MKTTINISNEKVVTIDLSKPIDISIPLVAGQGRLSAWYVPPIQIEPVKMGDWVGEVKSGASVNFRNIFFNPHGHGTHTETVGHISQENYPVNECIKDFFFLATLISIVPERIGEDEIINLDQIKMALEGNMAMGVIIRTLPNAVDKTTKSYSNSNPPYIEAKAAAWLREHGVKHLMIDLPSVDREEDGGALAAHHAFWNYPNQPQINSSITELIFIPSTIEDGIYMVNLQIAPFYNDAAPSRPLLFKLIK